MATDHHRPAVTMMRLVSRNQDVYWEKYSPGCRACRRMEERDGKWRMTMGEGEKKKKKGGEQR